MRLSVPEVDTRTKALGLFELLKSNIQDRFKDAATGIVRGLPEKPHFNRADMSWDAGLKKNERDRQTDRGAGEQIPPSV